MIRSLASDYEHKHTPLSSLKTLMRPVGARENFNSSGSLVFIHLFNNRLPGALCYLCGADKYQIIRLKLANVSKKVRINIIRCHSSR